MIVCKIRERSIHKFLYILLYRGKFNFGYPLILLHDQRGSTPGTWLQLVFFSFLSCRKLTLSQERASVFALVRVNLKLVPARSRPFRKKNIRKEWNWRAYWTPLAPPRLGVPLLSNEVSGIPFPTRRGRGRKVGNYLPPTSGVRNVIPFIHLPVLRAHKLKKKAFLFVRVCACACACPCVRARVMSL